MNQAVRDYVASVIERHPQAGKRVVEFGSFDVNGNPRDLFAGCASYVGIDKRPGPNVDVVCDAHEACEFEGHCDTVVCLEMLEHDTNPQATIDEAYGIIKEGGLLILTARGIGYGLHDEPEDYWRFTGHGLRLLMERAGFRVMEIIDHTESKGVFGYGYA